MEELQRLGREAGRDPLLERRAARIVAGSRGRREAAERIREYLEEHTRFAFDPPGTEFVRTPRLQLEEIETRGAAVGDCDDVAVLGAALCHAAGLRPRYRVLSLGPGRPWTHIYTEIPVEGGELVDLDVTRPDQFPPGLRIWRTETREA